MARGGAYGERIAGPRFELTWDDERYPDILKDIPNPPKTLFALGDLGVLRSPGLAVVGARRATPYGIGCAKRFASLAAGRGVVVISGGARGCDAAAHEAAMAAAKQTTAIARGATTANSSITLARALSSRLLSLAIIFISSFMTPTPNFKLLTFNFPTFNLQLPNL